jgi:5-methylcytosine-specific restriction endonuclease McrA
MELLARLKDRPCADCGERFPSYVMDFDHIGPKTGAVSSFVRSSSPKRLLAEAENCEVVCANCHRLRTWRRSKARIRRLESESDGAWRSLAARGVWDAEAAGSNPAAPTVFRLRRKSEAPRPPRA